MKKLFFLLILLSFLSCETTNVERPTNFKITEVLNGLDLKFTWNSSKSSGINRYRIYLRNSLLDSLVWEGKDTFAKIENPPLGKFYALEYREFTESNPSESIDTRPFFNETNIIWAGNGILNDTSKILGLYWDSVGVLCYFIKDKDSIIKINIDLYFNRNDTTFTSPHSLGLANLTNRTYFNDTTEFDSIEVAPKMGDNNSTKTSKLTPKYKFFVFIQDESTYILSRIDTLAISQDSISIKISYKFQKIKGYRRMK